MNNVLKSNVFAPGTKFVITDKSKDTKYTPGTTGFVVYVKGTDEGYVNVVHFLVVITKRGKTGKDRVEMGNISTPVFDTNFGKEPQLMPPDDRSRYVYINRLQDNIVDLRNNSPIDVLCWAFSKSLYLHRLYTSVPLQNKTWPSSEDNLLNWILDLENKFIDNSTSILENYKQVGKIKAIAYEVTHMESKLTRIHKGYLQKIVALERNSLEFLVGHYLNDKNILRCLENTIIERRNWLVAAF